ncbi:FkbM family methyltransferase [Pseudoruegeria sp. SHC-113]|uniref:FkbM family methyltransferase n=1 Tax=Pseudoruegeria sp. SHC-113 TaxID=2855439 RepID=UPI0021BB45B9|nr:FkbM family methyltransferase [Pseudoruegeria sp. SHC-113]MCT8162049.1 FkbM family methyltransferase [Pseudoruegeria sp. SHC-113]
MSEPEVPSPKPAPYPAPPGYALHQTRYGPMAAYPQDMYIGRSLAAYGEWCPAEMALLSQVLKPGDTVVDAGANIGAHTVPFSQKVGPNGTVFAIEMMPETARLLAFNTLINGCDNTRILNAGVASAEARIEMARIRTGGAFNFGGLSVAHMQKAKPGHGAVSVPLLPLDDMLRCTSLALIKADVEGHEAELLRGAKGLIETHRPVLYLEADHPESAEVLCGLLAGFGYAGYWHRAPLFSAGNWKENPTDIFGDVTCVNMLCVPETRAVAGLTRATGPESHPKFRRLSRQDAEAE